MSVNLTVAQLRAVLQLPERPFSDVFDYDGSPYYDLSRREPVTMLMASGTASATPYLFQQGVDYQLTANCIDWTLPGARKPDLSSPEFTINYTYSRLGQTAASTAVANAILITSMDLGATYPYGTTNAQGVSADQLATLGASFVAAREACIALQSTEVDLAQKSRRGQVLLDDSKKTADWQALAKDWDARYTRYLTMIRGPRTFFDLIRPSADNLVFGLVGRDVFDSLFAISPEYNSYGGYGALI